MVKLGRQGDRAWSQASPPAVAAMPMRKAEAASSRAGTTRDSSAFRTSPFTTIDGADQLPDYFRCDRTMSDAIGPSCLFIGHRYLQSRPPMQLQRANKALHELKLAMQAMLQAIARRGSLSHFLSTGIRLRHAMLPTEGAVKALVNGPSCMYMLQRSIRAGKGAPARSWGGAAARQPAAVPTGRNRAATQTRLPQMKAPGTAQAAPVRMGVHRSTSS